ncbi:AAA family ATPase [Chryseobacterium sp.]|uniref:AAA family ATPase n=1 Tax=Chryseobacterium sp. TaxID=1871047 RepID=UPI00289C54C3|nr:AAA family ATPase [Chryseobacterium sp.]
MGLKTNLQQSNFYVITGGPGVGKTSLIEELSRLGFNTVDEDARKIIKHQMEIDGDGLPWKDKELYAQLMFEASVKTYQSVEGSKLTFFDRGIPDALCYSDMENLESSEEFQSIQKRFRYNKTVFILPPWKEIYETDSERKQN